MNRGDASVEPLNRTSPEPSRRFGSAGWAWLALLAALTCVHIVDLWNSGGDVHGDVRIYHRTMQAIWEGKLPYRDFKIGRASCRERV